MIARKRPRTAETKTKEIAMKSAGNSFGRRLSGSIGLLVALAAMLALAAPAAAEWSITEFDGGAFDAEGHTVTQAGGHAFTATTTFFGSTTMVPGGQYEVTTEDLKDAFVELPPGVVGNPLVVDECTADQLSILWKGEENPPLQGAALGVPKCPLESQVGTITVFKNATEGKTAAEGGGPKPLSYPVYEMQAPPGIPALFGFNVGGNTYQVAAKVRTGGDYGITAGSANTSSAFPIAGVTFSFWGAPGDHHWDPIRGACMDTQTGAPKENTPGCPASVDLPDKAFFTIQTACTPPQKITLNTTTWQGSSDSTFFKTHDENGVPVGTEGCEDVPFEPTFSMQPDTKRADSSTGLDFALHIPQHEAPDEIATSHLRKAVVTLPEGMTVNPSGADGLGACTPAQIDLHGAGAANCPANSQVGTVEVETPLLDHVVFGDVYLASQSSFENSLIATYIAIDDPQSGVVVKLPGTISLDPRSGRLQAVFDNQPQLPFEDVRIHFKSGARAPLATPSACGTYSTEAAFYGWAGNPPSTERSSFTIDRGPDGGPCQLAKPFAPQMSSGLANPIAGSSSPFTLRLTRQDGSQEISGLALDLPAGLLAKLAGVSICPEAAIAQISPANGTGAGQIASPSCPANSLIGTIGAAAGAGTNPFWSDTGRLYLAGPYKGAPLSLLAVVPAVAGPFDLGNVAVRNAAYVDPKTAAVSVRSDPLPTILAGIPLKVRDLRVNVDRPNFMRAPTDCTAKQIAARVSSSAGARRDLANPFQVGDCSTLTFKPRLAINLKGGTKRGSHPVLQATLRAKDGESNIDRAAVTLPHSEFLDQAHIRTICTRVQFAAKACPAGSVYGEATAKSPLVDYPLTGSVYLRSSDNKLPDVVAVLRGPDYQPVEVVVVGRIDSIRGGIRTTFEGVPDAPVSEFTLQMQGGKKGLLINSTDICEGTHRAIARFGGQSGRNRTTKPAVRNSRCGKAHKRHSAHKRKGSS